MPGLKMKTKEEIEQIVRSQIETDVKPGDRAGGSGHSAYVTYKIDRIDTNLLDNNKLEVTYQYTVFVETEFTYYPDNPPKEDKYRKKLIIADS